MDSTFRLKFSISLFVLSFLLFLSSGKTAQALDEGDCFNSSTVVITGSITDSSGISKIDVTVDGSPPSVFNIDNGNWTATFTGLSDGPHTLLVTGTDACGSGNTATTDPLGFRVDTVAPNVWITEPIDGSTLCTGSIYISYIYDDPDTTCEERLDYGFWEPCGAGLPPIPDGPHTYEIKITDFCDNSDTDSVTFTVDVNPPTVDIISPTNGATIYSSTVVVEGTASDSASGMSQVCVSLDGGTCQNADLSGDNWSYTFYGVISGPHTLVTTAFDYCGYIGSDSVTVTVSYVPCIWFVNDNAMGMETGESWVNAFTVVQDAVNASTSGETICVAEGTYTNSPTSTASVLTMKAGIDIYGGFTGTESEISERGDPAANQSILDGEYISYHVVIGASKARLDGFTVTYGTASAGAVDNSGGGMYNEGVNGLVVEKCIFSENQAGWGGGGGIHNNGVTNLMVVNSIFSGNVAAGGGGMSNYNVNDLLVANCVFSGNIAVGIYGGGIENSDSSPTITNCIFSSNQASFAGGGIATDSSPDISNCTFSGNSAGFEGGGMFIINSTPTITNCIMWGDTAPTGPEISLVSSDFPSTLNISYSDVQGGPTTGVYIDPGCTLILGAGMIGELPEDDPLFVSGPDGDYYLSQTAAGQGSDSPCVDAGGDTAENLGLDDRTTRTDGIPDSGIADMGYHYEP